MIRPKIPLVANGQRLTSDLVNSMIHRTEYAADLLRQYRLTAGTEMYIEPHYDGTRVSYLQPVGGGQILPPPTPTASYRIVGRGAISGISATDRSYIYDPVTNLSISQSSFIGNFFQGISGQDIVGYKSMGFPTNVNVAMYYNGQTFQYFSHPDATAYTEFYATDSGVAVGAYYYAGGTLGYRISGIIYNLANGSYSSFNRPGFEFTEIYGIYQNQYVGISYQETGPATTWLYSGGSFINLNSAIGGFASQPSGIHKNYVVGRVFVNQLVRNGFIYNISTGQTSYHIPSYATQFEFQDIYENLAVGTAQQQGGDSLPIQYNLTTQEYSIIPSGINFYARTASGIG